MHLGAVCMQHMHACGKKHTKAVGDLNTKTWHILLGVGTHSAKLKWRYMY